MIHKTPPAGFSKKKLAYGPYSPSRLITAACPSRFFGHYVRKDNVIGASVSADRGNAIHEVLSKITEAHISGLIITPAQLSTWVSEAVGKYPASYQQIDLVKEAAEAYIANPSPYANKSTKCETSFAVQLWEEDTDDEYSVAANAFVQTEYVRHSQAGGDFFFGGHIDQLSIDEDTRVITVLDHKSTPSANENADHNFQVGAYAWLVSLFYPGYKVRTVLHYCHPRLNFYAPPVYWSYEDLQEMESLIISKVRAIESMEEFPAIPGNVCGYCHMIQECGIYNKVREQRAKGTLDMNIRSFDDLLRLAKELHVIDSISGEITKALKEGINTLCPTTGVDIGGVWYGYKVSEENVDWQATDKKIREESQRAKDMLESSSWMNEDDRLKMERISSFDNLDTLFTKHGLRPDSFKTYSNQKLKNIWRLDKSELFNELSEMLVKDKTTRFGAHKS